MYRLQWLDGEQWRTWLTDRNVYNILRERCYLTEQLAVQTRVLRKLA